MEPHNTGGEDSTKFDSMRDHMESTFSEGIEDLNQKKESGVVFDKGEANKLSNQVYYLMRKVPEEDRIIRNPETEDDPAKRGVDAAVHMGCHVVKYPHLIDATLDVLESLDIKAVPIGGFNNCCGIIDATMGDWERAEAVDNNRFNNISAYDPDYMITECTSCHATTEAMSIGYRDFDFEFLSFVEFLLNRKDDVLDLIERTDPVTVTLHDHYDGYDWMPAEQAEYARELFSSFPGVEVVEMEHNRDDYLPCNFYTDVSEYPYDDLSLQNWKEAEEVGADIMVHFWHACTNELPKYEPYFPLITRNYTTFIAERMGFKYENKNALYKKWGSQGKPEKILEHARSTFSENNISDEQAQEVIKKAYIETTAHIQDDVGK